MSGCSERRTSCGRLKPLPPEAPPEAPPEVAAARRRGCFLRHPPSRVVAAGSPDSPEGFRCSLLSLRRKGDRFRNPELRSGRCSVAELSSLDRRRRLKNPRDPDATPSGGPGGWMDASWPPEAPPEGVAVAFSAIIPAHFKSRPTSRPLFRFRPDVIHSGDADASKKFSRNSGLDGAAGMTGRRLENRRQQSSGLSHCQWAPLGGAAGWRRGEDGPTTPTLPNIEFHNNR